MLRKIFMLIYCQNHLMVFAKHFRVNLISPHKCKKCTKIYWNRLKFKFATSKRESKKKCISFDVSVSNIKRPNHNTPTHSIDSGMFVFLFFHFSFGCVYRHEQCIFFFSYFVFGIGIQLCECGVYTQTAIGFFWHEIKNPIYFSIDSVQCIHIENSDYLFAPLSLSLYNLSALGQFSLLAKKHSWKEIKKHIDNCL